MVYLFILLAVVVLIGVSLLIGNQTTDNKSLEILLFLVVCVIVAIGSFLSFIMRGVTYSG